MPGENKTITFEWVRNLIMVLGIVGVVFTAYLETTNKVVALEQKTNTLEGDVKDLKGVPTTLVRIEEQINSIRSDVSRIDNKLNK